MTNALIKINMKHPVVNHENIVPRNNDVSKPNDKINYENNTICHKPNSN